MEDSRFKIQNSRWKSEGGRIFRFEEFLVAQGAAQGGDEEDGHDDDVKNTEARENKDHANDRVGRSSSWREGFKHGQRGQ